MFYLYIYYRITCYQLSILRFNTILTAKGFKAIELDSLPQDRNSRYKEN